MVYQNKLAAVIKAGGRVLRESSGIVGLPFGSEYSLLLKNLDSVRKLVKVEIDGKDAGDGTKFIIQPNSSVELERFIRNGNFDKGNRFKFIERTADIEEHRGVKAEDGLVRIEYWTEQVTRTSYASITSTWPSIPFYTPNTAPSWPHSPTITYTANGVPTVNAFGSAFCNNVFLKSAGAAGAAAGASANMCQSFEIEEAEVERSAFNTAGITVPGSESTQKFQAASWFPTESQSDVIVLQLKGEVGGKPLDIPVTVQQKLICTSCGRSNKSSFKFCSKCGTALNLI